MRYRVERALDTDRDLALIFDFLVQSYIDFGDEPGAALDHAARRLIAIETAMEDLARAPHQGTLLPDLLAGLRSVTKDRAVFYFDVDDEQRVVRVLAIFFGAQDHRRHMLKRLMAR